MINLYPEFNTEEYISGETLVEYWNAVLPIDCKTYGINPLPIKRNEGVKYGEQGVVGRLFLTNYRLFFKAVNKFGRLIDGRLSIFLPSIVEVKNISFFTSREILIKTKLNECSFQILGYGGWAPGINREKPFIKKIEKCRTDFQDSFLVEIGEYLINKNDLIYDSFKLNKNINNLFNIFTAILHPENTRRNIIDGTLRIGGEKTDLINKECIGYKIFEEFKDTLGFDARKPSEDKNSKTE
jgi:hypothetical protein